MQIIFYIEPLYYQLAEVRYAKERGKGQQWKKLLCYFLNQK